MKELILLMECVIIVDNSEGGGCLIATATYGSEMAPQVQLLREIRDNQLMSTDSGVLFMTGFNSLVLFILTIYCRHGKRKSSIQRNGKDWNYTVAINTICHVICRIRIRSMLGYGIGVILMNLGMYVVVPAIVFIKTRKYIKI